MDTASNVMAATTASVSTTFEHVNNVLPSGDNFQLYVGIIVTLGICILLVTALFYYVRQRIAVLEHSHKEQVMVLHDFIRGTSNDLEIMKQMLMNIPVVFNGRHVVEHEHEKERNTKLIHISTDDEESDSSESSNYDSDDQSSSSRSSNTTVSDDDEDDEDEEENHCIKSENKIKVVELIDGMPIDYINGKHTSDYYRGMHDTMISKDQQKRQTTNETYYSSTGSDTGIDSGSDSDSDSGSDSDTDIHANRNIHVVSQSSCDLDIKCIHIDNIDNISDSSVIGQPVKETASSSASVTSSRESISSSNGDSQGNIPISDITILSDDVKYVHIIDSISLGTTNVTIPPPVAIDVSLSSSLRPSLPSSSSVTASSSAPVASLLQTEQSVATESNVNAKKQVPSTPLKSAAAYMNTSVGDLRQTLRDKIKELNISNEKVMEYGDIAKLKKPILIKILQEL